MKHTNRMIWWGVTLASLVVTWVATDAHVWYMSLIVGCADSLVLFGIWRGLAAAWISSVGAWGASLLWQAKSAPIPQASSMIAGMMGFGADAFLPVLLTLLVAFLLATAGSLVGLACLRLIRMPKRNFQ